MKFKVGQFVKIVSKAISRIVEVVEVNPTTACVQTVDGCRHHFNKDGKQCKPDGEPYVEHDFSWTLPEPDTYTLCHDEVRKVHRLDCDCDECWKHRAGVTRKRDGEFIGYYIKDFAELTEQEIFDKLQEGERAPCNWNYGGEAYYRWRIGLRARGFKWREEVVKHYFKGGGARAKVNWRQIAITLIAIALSRIPTRETPLERLFPNRQFATATFPLSCAVRSPIHPWQHRLPRQLARNPDYTHLPITFEWTESKDGNGCFKSGSYPSWV